MAEDQGGLRRDNVGDSTPWTKLFGAFKVAIDPKKLLLAAVGILLMSLGWALLSAFFFYFRSTPPAAYADSDEGFRALKDDRRVWNLFYEMAGPVPSSLKEAKDNKLVVDAVDLANDYEEFHAIEKAIDHLKKERDNPKTLITMGESGTRDVSLMLGGTTRVRVTSNRKEEIAAIVKAIDQKQLRINDLRIRDPKEQALQVRGYTVSADEDELRRAQDYILGVRAEQLKEIKNESVRAKALLLLDGPAGAKPAGRLRTLPWFEDRGPNQFLLVTGKIESASADGSIRHVPWERGQFAAWFVDDQVPVLLEPLVKFLRPVIYLFDPSAGFWTRVYLVFVIVWSLAVWAVFGGAITRIAVVQVARPTERVGLMEALRFAWSRKKSLISAPLFPLVFIGILTLLLLIFGLIEIWTFFVGDIIIAGLGWPIVLIFGLIMAVTLVGLVGYPLMYATISAEGSDSFDAISRSYSYVYQAPWNYLWYSAVALVYGAVLVFFVGMMGSLMVYLGKWGVSQAAGTYPSRDPAYLCVYAPTSFGWRDLLLHKSNYVTTDAVLNNSGEVVPQRSLNNKHMEEFNWHNQIGAVLVSFWLYLFFLMIVGFGYSYFWTASSIIYLLMRRRVDDTEYDEIYSENEDLDEPYPMPPMPEKEKTEPEGAPLTMVESPTLRGPESAPPPATSGPDGEPKPPTGGGPS
jgi:hypothetical protein